MKTTLRTLRDCRGQSMVEFAMIAPFLIILALGLVELGYGLLDQHVVTKLSREGANMISRNVPVEDASKALRNMQTRPVDFSNGTSKMIFSVVKRGETVGTTNYNKDLLYSRYEYGSGTNSKLSTRGPGSFDSDHVANNSDTDSNLQLTNLPPGMMTQPGGLVYVCEIYTKHKLITAFNKFGFTVPTMLYSIAYF